MTSVNNQIAKWVVDIGLLASFLVCVVTGIFKFTLLMRMLGLTQLVFPLALMSDIHDWSGILLIILVGVHLVLNRRWIWAMTKKILTGNLNKK
jgi:Domain of unknown function (DUF4405)